MFSFTFNHLADAFKGDKKACRTIFFLCPWNIIQVSTVYTKHQCNIHVVVNFLATINVI